MAPDTPLIAGPTSLHALMERKERWICPLFQRRYEWGKRQLDTLWEDVDAVLGENPVSRSRFLGAILIEVTAASGAGRVQENQLVDGQQRLTTFHLLVCAVVELLGTIDEDLDDDDPTPDDLARQYLVGGQASRRNEPRLRPTIQDTQQLNTVLRVTGVRGLDLPPNYGPTTGKILNAYRAILRGVRDRCGETDNPASPLSGARLRNFLRDVMDRISLVEIQLGSDHDPYEVFERLNTAGERLDARDLVRNYVFQRASAESTPDELLAVHRERWLPLEESFADAKAFEGFFFPFGTIHQPQTTQSRLFSDLRGRWRQNTAGESGIDAAVSIIDDLRDYVQSYNCLTGHLTDAYSKTVNEATARFARMRASAVVLPYLMRILRSYESKELRAHQVVAAFQTVESFLVRRALLGIEPTGLHAIFRRLHNEVGADPHAVTEYIDQNPTIVFPEDDEFVTAVMEGDLYHRKLASYVVMEYERGITGGRKPDPGATLDHVVPQSRGGNWGKFFSSEDHGRLVHTWANLVPLSSMDNSTKGSQSWAEARKQLKHETHFKTSKLLLDRNKRWTPSAVEKRAAELATWATKRWPKLTY